MTSSRTASAAALGAVLLALLLALVDRGGPAPRPGGRATEPLGPEGPAAPAWTSVVEAGGDHVTGTELVALLARDPAGVLLVDVRPAEDFAAFSLRGSHRLDLPALLGAEGERLLAAHPRATVVLVSQGMTHPAQAWVGLATRGGRDVRVLEDGLDGLRRGVLAPPALRGPTTARAARAAWGDHVRAHALLLGRVVPPLPAVPARLATDPADLVSPTVVSPEWVAARGPGVVVLDTREKSEDYAAGHVPGALHLPIAATRETRDGVADEALPPPRLAEVFGRLGIDATTPVVAYAGERLQDPTHAALALVSLGHAKVAVMEGGLGAWRARGLPVATQAPPPPTPRTYEIRPGAADFWKDLDAVIASSRGQGPPILDVRPGDAFRGETSGGEARAGRIPGSLHRAFKDDTAVTETGVWWRSLDELRDAYAALGLSPDRPVVVSCRTGHQASQTWFTLRYLLGFADVGWYDGSWKEWAARPDLPVETGPSRDPSPP